LEVSAEVFTVTSPKQRDAGRILLAGGSGYVGGRLLRVLEASGRPLRCLPRKPEFLPAD
jgi:nucleoside-diphosphate-sugar epimerase